MMKLGRCASIMSMLTLATVSLLTLGVARPTAEGPQAAASSKARFPRNVTEFDQLFKEVSNWGRWGKTDVLGTLNLITDAKRVQAAALVKHGIAVSLAHDGNGIMEKAEDQRGPIGLTHQGGKFEWSFHGPGNSHIDAPCEAATILWAGMERPSETRPLLLRGPMVRSAYGGKAYNGYPASEIVKADGTGCTKLGAEIFKNGIVTRGILIDIPRLKGVPYLELSTPVFPEDIEAWEKMAGMKIATGDAIFLRTGRWARRAKLGPWNPHVLGGAGFHASAARFFKQRDVAVVGTDFAAEVFPSLVEGVPLPIHILLQAALGSGLFDAQDLEALAETAAKLNRWEFMLTGAPLRITGASGSPLNMTALF